MALTAQASIRPSTSDSKYKRTKLTKLGSLSKPSVTQTDVRKRSGGG
jgi:hypothetical protein